MVFFRQFEEPINLALVSTADDEAAQHVVHPGGTFAGRCALAAGFTFVELWKGRELDLGGDGRREGSVLRRYERWL